MIDLVYDHVLSNFSLRFRLVNILPLLKARREHTTVKICEFEVWFYNYLKFLPVFFLESFTVSTLKGIYAYIRRWFANGLFLVRIFKRRQYFIKSGAYIQVSWTNWRQLEFGNPWIASILIQCSSVLGTQRMCDDDEPKPKKKLIMEETSSACSWTGTLITGPCYNAAKRTA